MVVSFHLVSFAFGLKHFFDFSYDSGLLVTNSPSCLSENKQILFPRSILVLPLSLKDTFVGYRIPADTVVCCNIFIQLSFNLHYF